MLLFKNIASQSVYTRVTSVSTGLAVTGKTLTSYISQDNGAFTATTNAPTEKAYGIYTVALTAAETNCTAGCIVFTGNSSGEYVETVYFETTSQNPTVGAVVGNIGTVGTPVTMYATHVGNTTGNTTGNITGNLTGSVGSVTGSVGSVTGSVGSVTGSVGSVTGNVGGKLLGDIGTTGTPVAMYATHVGNTTGNITGNLTGSVGSVTGSVGSVTGSVGSVTGNVGGNVVGTVGSLSSVGGIVSAIKTETYDGITQDTLYKILAAFIFGKVEVNDNPNDATKLTIRYYLPNDGSQILEINASKFNGARGTAGSVGGVA
jgi:hypothetical protein